MKGLGQLSSMVLYVVCEFFFFQAEDGIRDVAVTGVQTCALPISTDSNATLPTSASMVSGSKIFSVTLNTIGSATLTATDLDDGSKTASTSPAMKIGRASCRERV